MRVMKDSGIEWIGEIPQNWSISPLFCYFTEGRNPNVGLKNDNLLSLSYGNIIRKDINTKDGLLPANFESYNIVRKHHIIVRTLDLQNDKKSLRTGLVKEESGIITSAYLNLVPKQYIYSPYYYYLLHVYDLIKVFYNMGNGVRQSLNFKEFSKLPLISPTDYEQKKIADYLDSKCSQIDLIIEKQKQIIEKLKEYKTSLITEVVTKGLDPDVEMKDSGVEWIGKTPKHWLPIPLKYVVDCNKCVLSEKTRDDFEFDYVDIGSVVYGKGIVLKQHMSFKNSPSRARRIVQSKDVIISTVRTYLKAIAVIPDDIGVMVVSTGFAVLTNKKSILPNFLGFYVQSHPFVSSIESRSLGISYPAINASQLVCINVLLPPLDEQRKIVAHLDAKCSLIDKTISDRQIAIEKLQEYKKSLIYEVVTGKREV